MLRCVNNAARCEMCDLLRVGIRTPNTDMIIGAVLSGGDVMGLAKKLANGGGSLL